MLLNLKKKMKIHSTEWIREVERSERSLLLQLQQFVTASHQPSMHHSKRLDQKLYMLREEVRTMSREKEQVENVWRERLLRCQCQLQAKEEEMNRQSQYFENFKSQLQCKLKQSRDREETLQNRIYTLEKQILEMTVTAATGIATMGPVRITAGTVTHWEQQDRLPSLRGEGEGEEEKKEERKRQWPTSLGSKREGSEESGQCKTEKDVQKDKDSNETRLQGFILSLQEDLRVLLEREEKAMTEQRALMEQLHEAQESNHFLGCKVEEMKSEIHQLNLSKVSLDEEAEELREENQRLQQSLRDEANNLPNIEDACIQKVQSNDECKTSLSAVPLSHHQATAESSKNGQLDHFSAAKSETSFIPRNGPQTFFGNFGLKTKPCVQPLRLTTETIDELRIGTWCYNGVLNLEESPSEDSDALREAYRSLGLGEELEVIKEQHDRLENALQQAKEQITVITQENAQLKSQIKQQQEHEDTSLVCAETDQFSTMEDSTDDLVHALNEENRALADRIQELRAHIELREEEIQKEQIDVKEHISKLEADGAQQQQENHEQGCLITELTRKTEDDLNTIMELQQKLMEYEQFKEDTKHNKPCGTQTKHTQTVFSKENLDECVDLLVNCVIEGDKEPQFMSDKQQETMNEASQMMFCGKSLDNPHTSVLSEQVDQLTKLIQSLKTEQEELTGCIKYQREQQKEVSQSIQAQTEAKQRLTREIWGLKEEKDNILKSLAGLKQDREQLTRAVCGLKDERDQFQRSMSGLKEEKEQLSENVPTLKKEKDTLLESISSGIRERDQALQSLQNLQNESRHLSQAVLNLKQEKDELTRFLKSVEDRRDKEQQYDTLQGECAKLKKSLSSLKEEEVRIEFSISRLKQEEKQMMLLLQGLQDEHSRLQTTSPSQTQTREKVKLHPLNTMMRGTECEEEYEAQCQNNYEHENPNALIMDTETLKAELQKSHEELEKTLAEKKRLQNEIFQSETKREEAERRASQSADKLLRLTDVASQLEETRNQNDNLKAQVKELQSKVTGLAREKSEALTMKGRTEEQNNMLTAQLKAKTVALEELNSEYISLKRGQATKDELSAVLASLQTRYNDIRAKYDALLHRKSQADLDIAPLKAKLSCLVVKCQERNNMLVQMTKVMQKHGCVDYILKQQVEQLLSDPAVQSYASMFTAGLGSGFTPKIMINFEDSNTFTQEQPCSAVITPLKQQSEFTHGSNKLGDDKSPSLTTAALMRTSTTLQNCTNKIKPESIPTLEKKAISPKLHSPIQHKELLWSTSPSVPMKENTHTTQLSPSARGPVHKTSGFQQLNIKAESSPDLTRLTESSGFFSSPTSSVTRFGPSKRLSSPEKIMSLQEQLQKTLLSSYQAPEGRERGQKPKKYLSFSAQTLALSPASQIHKPNLSVYNPPTNPLPVTTASIDAEPTSGATTKHTALNKPTTLFNAVVSRSATVHFSPTAQTFTHQRSKANVSRTSSSVSSLSNSCHASAVQSRTKLTSSSGANKPISPKLTNKFTTNESQNKMTVSISPAATNSDVVKCPDTPKSTASDTTAPSRSSSLSIISKTDGPGGLLSAPHSSTSAKQSSDSSEKARTPTRTKQDAPAEVRSVEVIKTVGLSSLMIGWERPTLDELGCSNGTFVYGYRVFVDGVFHKSVMSSACTKCILENVNLSVPINISVQTLGSNGLSSNSVHTTCSLAGNANQ